LLLKLGIKDDLDKIEQKDNNRKLALNEALADYEFRMCFLVTACA
jgi:hypothetical protein